MALYLLDKTANANNLTNVNSVAEGTSVPPFPQSYTQADLELGSTQYLTAADSSSLQISTDITLEAWVRPESLGGANLTIMCKGRANGDATCNYALRIHSGGWIDFTYAASGPTFHTWSTSAVVCAVGRWNHVALTYTFGTAASIVCYVDGVSKTGAWTQGTGNSAVLSSTEVLQIGTLHSVSGADELFDGMLDEVRIWNIIRSGSDISTNLSVPLIGTETGLKAYYRFQKDVTSLSASGGTITNVGGRTIHTFTTDGNFISSGSGTVEYLIVGGGGGGGGAAGTPDAGAAGGGGGAGGARANIIDVTAQTYAVVVGAGGTGNHTTRVQGGTGGASSAFGVSAGGGGGGGYAGTTGGSASNGAAGGSGGGAGGTYNGATINGGGVGSFGEGNVGGSNISGAGRDGAGGGGWGAVGTNSAGNSTGYAGGAGLTSSISGASTSYAGGGGGGNWDGTGAAAGGSSIGGSGGTKSVAAGNGTANTGSGGGGGGATNNTAAGTASGAGSAGVVIISYITPNSVNYLRNPRGRTRFPDSVSFPGTI